MHVPLSGAQAYARSRCVPILAGHSLWQRWQWHCAGRARSSELAAPGPAGELTPRGGSSAGKQRQRAAPAKQRGRGNGVSSLDFGAAAPSGSQQQSSRGRQSGLCVCSACGKDSNETAWQFKRPNPQSGKELSIDDKCESCWRCFVSGFVSYMSWQQYCLHVQSDEGRNEAEQVGSILSGGARNFFPEQIGEMEEWGIQQGRYYLILNDREFANYMQARPHAKMPKAPTMQVPKEDGSGDYERVWCFEHPDHPFRTAFLFSKRTVARNTLTLQPEAHFHSRQGQELTRLACSNMKEKQSMEVLSSQVSSLDDYKERFLEQKRKNSRNEDADAVEGEGDSEISGEEPYMPGGAAAPPSLLGHHTGGGPGLAQPKSGKAAKATAGATGMNKVFSAGSATLQPMVSPPAKRAACADIEPDDSASVISRGARISESAKKMRGQGSGADHYINTLDIEAILTTGKPGVHLHHARLQVAKFSENDPDKARLAVHLSQVEKALKIAPQVVQALPKKRDHRHLGPVGGPGQLSSAAVLAVSFGRSGHQGRCQRGLAWRRRVMGEVAPDLHSLGRAGEADKVRHDGAYGVRHGQ